MTGVPPVAGGDRSISAYIDLNFKPTVVWSCSESLSRLVVTCLFRHLAALDAQSEVRTRRLRVGG